MTFISGKTVSENNFEDIALEVLEKKDISLRGQQGNTTGNPGVFYSEESSELKTRNLKNNHGNVSLKRYWHLEIRTSKNFKKKKPF